TWKRATDPGAGARPTEGVPPEGVAARRSPASRRTDAQAAPGLFDERIRLTPEALDPAGESGLMLLGALGGLDGAIKLVKDAREDVLAIGRRAAEIRQQLSFLLRVNDDAYVYFLEIRGRTVVLRASPIDVSQIVRK